MYSEAHRATHDHTNDMGLEKFKTKRKFVLMPGIVNVCKLCTLQRNVEKFVSRRSYKKSSKDFLLQNVTMWRGFFFSFCFICRSWRTTCTIVHCTWTGDLLTFEFHKYTKKEWKITTTDFVTTEDRIMYKEMLNINKKRPLGWAFWAILCLVLQKKKKRKIICNRI